MKTSTKRVRQEAKSISCLLVAVFAVTAFPSFAATYYKVGDDPVGKSSFDGNVDSSCGWSTTSGASSTVTVSDMGNSDFIIDNGRTLRLPATTAAITFAGRSLELAGGGKIAFKTKSANRTVAIGNLVIAANNGDVGGVLSVWDNYTFTLRGEITLESGAVMSVETSNDSRKLYIESDINGDDSTTLLLGSSAGEVIIGNANGFYGTVVGSDSASCSKLSITNGFSGTIASLPSVASEIRVNVDGLPSDRGLIMATDSIPDSIKDKVVFYSNTRGELSVGDVLMTFPAGTDVDPGDFTIKFATGFGAAGSELDVKAVANGDGTISLAVDGVVIYDSDWTGLGDGKRFGDRFNWKDEAIPAEGSSVRLGVATNSTLVCDILFKPGSITFVTNSAVITISGPGTISGVTAIANLTVLSCHHVFDCDVTCAGGVTPDISCGLDNYMTFAGGITMYNAPKTGGGDSGKDCWSGNVTVTTKDGQRYSSDGSRNYGVLTPDTTFTFDNGMLDRMHISGGAGAVAERLVYNGCARNGNNAWYNLVFDNGNGTIRTKEIRTEGDAVLFHSYADTDMVGGTIIAGKLSCATTKNPEGAFPYPVFMLNCGQLAGNVSGGIATGNANGEGVWVIGPGGLAFGDTVLDGSHFETAIGKSLGGRPAATLHSYADWALQAHPNGRDKIALQIGGSNGGYLVIDTSHYAIDDVQYDSATNHTVTLDGKVESGGAIRIEGNGKVVFANEHNSGTGGLTVTDTATASVKAGCRPGGGAVTVDSGATLEVAESGTVALGGSLTLNADASLGFNFTEWATAPKLAVPGAVTANGAVVVRISADEGMRPAHGTGGKFVLTSGGKFNGVAVSLDETNKPYWVKGVSVENGEIVLSVRSAGLIYVE